MIVRDWDAATYHRVSVPHQEWAESILARLPLRGAETVLDAGCGSGRVTATLRERVPRGKVIAVDGSPSMVAEARAHLPADVEVLEQDLLELALPGPVDAVFSSAVFHWITDHPRLFARLRAAMRPGAPLAAQCGGEGNVAAFHVAAADVAARSPYAEHVGELGEAWHFAGPDETERRLPAAGFVEVRAWLEPWAVAPPEPGPFLQTVCLGPWIDRLPAGLHDAFGADVLAELGEPLVLDYVRLNIAARAGA